MSHITSVVIVKQQDGDKKITKMLQQNGKSKVTNFVVKFNQNVPKTPAQEEKMSN
jgi:hypothetical protein